MKTKRSGYTMLEILVALAVLFILIALSTPSLIGSMKRQKLDSIAIELAGALRTAQQKTILNPFEQYGIEIIESPTQTGVYGYRELSRARSGGRTGRGTPGAFHKFKFDARSYLYGEVNIANRIQPAGSELAGCLNYRMSGPSDIPKGDRIYFDPMGIPQFFGDGGDTLRYFDTDMVIWLFANTSAEATLAPSSRPSTYIVISPLGIISTKK